MDADAQFPRYTPLVRGNLLQAYAITMRPYLMFVSGITGISALSFAPELSLTRALIISTASFLSYGFGQALTDCFQTDTDSLSAPYRPLIQGIVSTKHVLSLSVGGLSACVVIFSLFHPANLILGFSGGVGLATYTFFKRKWWSGPLYNAWIVGALFLMAFLAGGGTVAAIVSQNVLFTTTTVFFGYANFVLSGYFKDVEPDRCTGYKTFPVVFGRRRSAYASDVLALLTLLSAAMILAGRHALVYLQASILLIPGALALTVGQVHLHSVRSDNQAHQAIVPILHSYLLLLSGIALLQKPTWGIWIVLFYTGFLVAMRSRPVKQQI